MDSERSVVKIKVAKEAGMVRDIWLMSRGAHLIECDAALVYEVGPFSWR